MIRRIQKDSVTAAETDVRDDEDIFVKHEDSDEKSSVAPSR